MYGQAEDRNKSGGFTILELMIVVLIIGLIAVVAAPTVSDLVHRNRLADMVQMTQGIGHQARTYATQTKRASVVEFREDAVWINLLDGADCWSAISNRCLTQAASETTGSGGNARYRDAFQLSQERYVDAGAVICGGTASFLDNSGGCQPSVALNQAAFALCYSGKGELFVRNADDAATACNGSGAVVAAAGWGRGCNAGQEAAEVYFNRFENAVCGGTALDVRRSVDFPLLGSPSSRVNPEVVGP